MRSRNTALKFTADLEMATVMIRMKPRTLRSKLDQHPTSFITSFKHNYVTLLKLCVAIHRVIFKKAFSDRMRDSEMNKT